MIIMKKKKRSVTQRMMNATPHLGGKEIRGNEHRFQWEETKPSEEKEVILEELLGPKIAY